MRHLILLICMFACTSAAFSQQFEVGPFIGGANYIGDVGSTTYINPTGLLVGGLAKYNRSNRHSYRLSVMYAQFSADDAKSSQVRRQQRGYSFTNYIAEASLGIEFNFYSFDLSEADTQSTPYLYTGVTYFNSKHLYLNRDLPARGILETQGNNWEFSIPMVMGFKQTLSKRIIGAIEIGARYTFTDNIDGSNPQELLGRREPLREFGNRNTTDWYVFSGVSLTFTFGRKPCYSHF